MIKIILSDWNFIAPCATFVEECKVNGVIEEQKRESPVTKEIPWPSNCSPSALTGPILDKESEDRYSRCKLQGWKDWNTERT